MEIADGKQNALRQADRSKETLHDLRIKPETRARKNEGESTIHILHSMA